MRLHQFLIAPFVLFLFLGGQALLASEPILAVNSQRAKAEHKVVQITNTAQLVANIPEQCVAQARADVDRYLRRFQSERDVRTITMR